MSDTRPEPTKPRKQKNWARIYGACKGGKLSDKGQKAAPCIKCGTTSKRIECPFCGTRREGK